MTVALLAANVALGAINQSEITDGIDALLTGALDNDGGEARNYSFMALRRIGKPAIDPLINLLHHEDHRVRERAAQALGIIGEDVSIAVPALIRALNDPHPNVRGASAGALGISQRPDLCVPALLNTLTDDEEYPRRITAMVLPKFEDETGQIVEHLKLDLSSQDARRRRGAASALGYFTKSFEDIVPKLVSLLDDPDPRVRRAALNGIRVARVDTPDCLAKIIEILKNDTEPEVRIEAARATQVAGFASPNLPAVIAAMADAIQNDEHACSTAAGILGNLLPAGHQALLQALASGNEWSRISAARICAERSDLSKLAEPLLIEALSSQARDMRWYAALGLVQLKEPPESAIRVLAEILKSPDKENKLLRERAVNAASRMGNPGVPYLALATKDPVWYIRIYAINALTDVSGSDDFVIPVVRECLHDQVVAVRVSAAKALGSKWLVVPEVKATLQSLLKDKEPRVRLCAAEILTAAPGSASIDAANTLKELLDNSDAYVQQSAASKLSNLGGHSDAVLPALLNGLMHRQRAGSTASDILAAQTFAVYKSEAAIPKKAIRYLRVMLTDKEKSAQIAAIAALTNVDPDREGLAKPLIQLIQSDVEEVSRRAISALAELGPDAMAAIPALTEICRSNWRLRDSAHQAIEMILAEDVARFRSEIDPRLVSILVGLGSDDSDEGGRAYWDLEEMGQAAVPEILKVLSDPKYRLQEKAAEALATLAPRVSGAEAAIPYLIALQDDYRPNVRVLAIAALAAINAPPDLSLPAYIRALRDTEYGVISEAARILGKMGPTGVPALPALVDALGHEAGASQAARAIIDIGTVPPDPFILLHIFENSKPGEWLDSWEGSRRAVTRVLCFFGPASQPLLHDLVRILRSSGDDDLRWSAAQILGAIGPQAADAASELRGLAVNAKENWKVRVACAGALKNVSRDSEEAKSILAIGLQDTDKEVRFATVMALASIKTADKTVIDLLGKALNDAERHVQLKAMTALRFSDGDVRPLLPAIRNAMHGPKDEVYWAGIATLERLGEHAAE